MLTKHLSKLDPRRSATRSPQPKSTDEPAGSVAAVEVVPAEPVAVPEPPVDRKPSHADRKLAQKVAALTDQVAQLEGRLDLASGCLAVDRAVSRARPARRRPAPLRRPGPADPR